MSTLLTNISRLQGITEDSSIPKIGSEMMEVHSIENAFLQIEDGVIKSFGPMDQCPSDAQTMDCKGRMVMPAYVDSHTHIVFAKSRSSEFKMRLEGRSYQEIAQSGGGILNSAQALRLMSEDQLFNESKERIQGLRNLGTGSFEIKSGYGLDFESELKMLRVIQRLRDSSDYTIKSTFLGAHAVPETYGSDRKGYITHITDDMLPAIVDAKLADYIDIFCESGYFDLDDMSKIINEAASFGLKAKVHVNQFNSIGAIPLACNLGALSVDHLEVMEADDFKALENGHTIAVALPLCSLFLKIPYAPARQLIDRRIPFVLASDFNPGSAPSGNLNLAFALSCSQMGLRPEESFNALTYNAAFAIEEQKKVGSIEIGKKAILNIMKPKFQNLVDIAYWFGENPVDQII